MSKASTISVRMKKSLHKDLINQFPEVNMSDLLSVMYKTSALRLENVLRKKKK